MTLLRAFWDAAREIEPSAAAADEGVVMRWCAEGELGELWRAAGLDDVRLGALVVRASYASFEDLWSPLPTGVAPSGAFCKSLDTERRAALRDAYRRRLGVGEVRSSSPPVPGAVAPCRNPRPAPSPLQGIADEFEVGLQHVARTGPRPRSVP